MSATRLARLGACTIAAALLAAVPASPALGQGAPELQLREFVIEPVAPGDLVGYQPVIHNSGSATTQWIALRLTDAAYARHATRFSNCLYEDDEFTGTSQALCEFEFDLAPGETAQVTADTQVDLLVQPNVPDQGFINASYSADAFDGPLNPQPGEPGDGPELELEKIADAPGDLSPDFANVILRSGPNPTDLAAVGTEITGEVGDVVTVPLGIENRGAGDLPAVLPGGGPAPGPQLTITFPAGVTVLEILPPDGDLRFTSGCHPVVDGEPDFSRRNQVDGLQYMCFVSELPLRSGESWLFPFRVEIADDQEASGEVLATTGSNDPDHSNNLAAITLRAAGAGAGGGGGLPVTGASSAVTAGVGLLVLLAGAAAVLLARGRRLRFVSTSRD